MSHGIYGNEPRRDQTPQRGLCLKNLLIAACECRVLHIACIRPEASSQILPWLVKGALSQTVHQGNPDRVQPKLNDALYRLELPQLVQVPHQRIELHRWL